ncbi:MAG: NAD(P)/FAD-dependent oxidoreductase [Candidatus Nanohaloarchaea archaeon]
MPPQYLIIGNGIAGATAAETLREESDAEITVLTDEEEPLYNRIMLKTYMKGKLPKKYTRVHDQEWYEKRDIELKLDEKAVKVDTEEKTVETEEESYSYDKLLVATGGSPRNLPQDEGFDNIEYMWTIDDAERLKQQAEEVEKAVVVGGGLLGIDFAAVFAEHGCDVDYLIRADRWWHRGLDQEGAEIIHRKLKKKGVNIVTDAEVEELEAEGGEVRRVKTKDGESFECDVVPVAIGHTPNSGFIDVEKNCSGLIKTDRFLETSETGVYAAGDMVEYYSPVFERRVVNGSWDHSEAMGKTAAENMLADSQEARQPFTFVNTYGVGHFDKQFLAIGDWSGDAVSRKYSEDEYRRLFFKDDRLVGAVMIGFTEGQEEIKELIREKKEVSDREALIEKEYWQK